MLVRDVLKEVSYALQDVEQIRWPWPGQDNKPGLVDFLNEAVSFVVSVKPDAASVTEEVQLSSGSMQRLPDRGVKLLRILNNAVLPGRDAGPMIRETNLAEIKAYSGMYPAQRGGVELFARHGEGDDPKIFWVLPPQSIPAGKVVMTYVRMPDKVTGPDDVVGLGDEYLTALIEYVLYRVASGDNDSSGGQAGLHMGNVQVALTGKRSADLMWPIRQARNSVKRGQG